MTKLLFGFRKDVRIGSWNPRANIFAVEPGARCFCYLKLYYYLFSVTVKTLATELGALVYGGPKAPEPEFFVLELWSSKFLWDPVRLLCELKWSYSEGLNRSVQRSCM